MFESIDRETEGSLREAVDGTRLRSHVDALSDLRRYPGSDDQWEAAEYVVETLRDAGVDATLHTAEAYTSVPVDAAVTVTAPHRETIDDAITTAFSANTAPAGVSGELVHVESLDGDGPPAGVDGSVVLTRGLPTPAAIRKLEASGASAAVFESVTEGHLHEMIVSPVWGSPALDDLDDLPSLPVAQVHRRDGGRLADLVAGDDVEVTVRTQTRCELSELPCPVGRIDGTASDRYCLVGNHVDSWHEGVTDNATAVAATLELARLFADAEPKRGLVFGFWPGHSMGRYAGSAWYADERWLDLRENGVAYLHLDLNGLDGADELWFQHMAAVEDEHLAALETGPLPLGTKGDDGLLGGTDRPGRSSDQSFWGAGLASLLSGARFSDGHEEGGPVGGGWWWHTPADRADKVDPDLLVEEVEVYVAILSRFCNSPVLPHDFRNTCRDVRDTLESLDLADAAVDDALDELDALEANLERLADRIDDVDPGAAGVDADIEDLQVRLGNALIPALYMGRPDHEQEPALPHDLLPSFRVGEPPAERTGRDRRAAEITLRRASNRLAHRLRLANRAVGRYLDGTGD